MKVLGPLFLVACLAGMAIYSAHQLIQMLNGPAPATFGQTCAFVAGVVLWGCGSVCFGLLPLFVIFAFVIGPIRPLVDRARMRAQRSRAEHALAKLANDGPRALSAAEAEKVKSLLSQGNEDGFRLAVTVLESSRALTGDMAAVFTPDVLDVIAKKTGPDCWLLGVRTLQSVEPALQAFATAIARQLEASAEQAFVETGFMGHVQPSPAWQAPYKVLLEQESPGPFIEGLTPLIRKQLDRSRLNLNMYASYFVYAFAFEQLTALSVAGARILATLAMPEKRQLPVPPWWEPYGQHLALSRLPSMSDEAAGSLSASKRAVLFGALESFPDTPGHIKLARRLATQRHVVLGSATQLGPTVARILSSTVVSPPNALRDILYCDFQTQQDRNRAFFVSAGGGVPNILR